MFASFSKREKIVPLMMVVFISSAAAAIAIDHAIVNKLSAQSSYAQAQISKIDLSIERDTVGSKNTKRQIIDFINLFTKGGYAASAKLNIGASQNLALIQASRSLRSQVTKNQSTQIQQGFSDFSQVINTTLKADIKKWTLMKFALLAFSLVGLTVLLVFLVRNLSKARTKLNSEAKLKKSILEGLQEGFFVIDRDLRIGEFQSSATRQIFNKPKAISGNFFELIKPMVNKRRFKDAKEYIASLLDQRNKNANPKALNPLRRVEFVMPSGSSLVTRKYLNFEFSRNRSEKGLELLVSVRDVTKVVDLAQELKVSNEDRQLAFEQIVDNLAPADKEIDSFYEAASETLQDVHSMLNTDAKSTNDQTEKLKRIQTKVLKIQKSASGIGLNLIQSSAQQLDQQIQDLKSSDQISAKQILSLMAPLQQMIADVEFTHELNIKQRHSHDTLFPSRLQLLQNDDLVGQQEDQKAQVHTSRPAEARTENVLHRKKLNMVAEALAARDNKEVRLEIRGLYDLPMHDDIRSTLESISIQLLRNALVYSIEAPEVRARLSKPSKGQLTINIKDRDADHVALVVRDDGAGLNFSNIRAKAIAAGLVSETLAKKMSESQTVACLFKSKFSDHNFDVENSNEKRSYGLDLIREQVEKLNGKISVKSSSGLYSQISIIIPKSLLDRAAA